MKKILLISILFITSCGTMKDMYVNNFTQHKSTAFFYRGMTEEEFIRKNPSITEKINELDEFSTYIESEQKYRYIWGIAIPLAYEEYMFEFKNDTLIAIYRGRNNYNKEIDYGIYSN